MVTTCKQTITQEVGLDSHNAVGAAIFQQAAKNPLVVVCICGNTFENAKEAGSPAQHPTNLSLFSSLCSVPNLFAASCVSSYPNSGRRLGPTAVL